MSTSSFLILQYLIIDQPPTHLYTFMSLCVALFSRVALFSAAAAVQQKFNTIHNIVYIVMEEV